jgi:hypothetical protein
MRPLEIRMLRDNRFLDIFPIDGVGPLVGSKEIRRGTGAVEFLDGVTDDVALVHRPTPDSLWVFAVCHGDLPTRFDEPRPIRGTHPDLAGIFEAIRDSVDVPLEVMRLFAPQLFWRKRVDRIVRGDLEALPDHAPIRREEASLGIAGIPDDTVENSTVVWTTDELEVNCQHRNRRLGCSFDVSTYSSSLPPIRQLTSRCPVRSEVE